MKKNRKRTIISALGAATVGAGIGVAAIAQACGPSGNDNPEIIEYAKYSETHNLAFWSNQTNHADFVSLSGAISDIAGSIGNNTSIQWSILQNYVGLIPASPTLVSVQQFDPDRIYEQGGVRETIQQNSEVTIFYMAGLLGLIYFYGSISGSAQMWETNVFTPTNVNMSSFLANIQTIFTNINSNIQDYSFLRSDFFLPANVAQDETITESVTVSNDIASQSLLTSIYDLFNDFTNSEISDMARVYLTYMDNVMPAISTSNPIEQSSLNLNIGYNNSDLILRLGSEQNPDGYTFLTFQSNNNSLVEAIGVREEYFTEPTAEARRNQAQVFRTSSIVLNNPPITGINFEEQAIVLA